MTEPDPVSRILCVLSTLQSMAAEPIACRHNFALDSVILHMQTFIIRKPFTQQSWDTTLKQFWKPVSCLYMET
jgi:hypothetical protein